MGTAAPKFEYEVHCVLVVPGGATADSGVLKIITVVVDDAEPGMKNWPSIGLYKWSVQCCVSDVIGMGDDPCVILAPSKEQPAIRNWESLLGRDYGSTLESWQAAVFGMGC